MNNLQNQVSPYLLQHKNNPVDWFPWGEIALELAIKEDKPIILSIGYAACHWCHVMEHESFENQEVADLMNAHFICIKVDREERTDIDLIYMDAIHAMGLQGGWPLHVFLMPDQKPFYGGTYFPKANWIQLLHSIQRAYQDNKIELQHSANNFANNLNDTTIGLYPMNLDVMSPIIPSTIEVILKGLDPIYGGTNKAPKFPIPSLALFLESLPKKLYKMSSIQKQADLQLTKMALGGIFDQVGGGFSRYSVDSEWFCPHFEKMLYDNAQLIRVYALAYQRTQNPLYREVLSKTIEFVTSELQDTNGLYWTALDADSEGVEGLFYVWTYQELNELLPYISHQAFYQAFSISSKGNWEHNYNILFKKDSFLNLQFEFELNVLKSARSKRSRPSTDTKQLLAWNALLAVGLIDSAKSLSDKNLLIDALSLVDSILNQFTDKNMNFVNHQIMFANKPISAFLDDLAALGLACMMAYQSQGNVMYLIRGKQLYHFIETNHFKQNNLYSYLSNQNDKLIASKFEIVDSVCPSANSMVCEFYLWLGFLSDEPKLTIIGKNMIASVLEQAQANPIYFANWLRIYSEWIENPKAIVKYNPNRINMEDLSCLNELCIPVIDLKNKFMVCIGDRCLLPCDDILILKEQLKSI